MKFEKGKSGNVSRGKEHSWARISFWMDRINKEWDKLTPNQRAHYSVELTKLLVSKLKALPGDPNDSSLNAQSAMDELKAIESKSSVKQDSVTTPKPPVEPA